MSRREIGILIAMLAVVLYGGYTYMFAPAATDLGPGIQAEELDKLEAFVKDTTETLQKNNLSKTEAYSIARTEARWARMPFEIGSTVAQDKEVEAISFVYSGFMGAKGMSFAIINGLEYSVHDEIEPGGFVLEEILPEKVVIAVEGKKQTIIVPRLD